MKTYMKCGDTFIKHSEIPVPYYARANAVFTNKGFMRPVFHRDGTSVELMAANFCYGLNPFFKNKSDFVKFWRKHGKTGVIAMYKAMKEANGNGYKPVELHPVVVYHGTRKGFVFLRTQEEVNNFAKSHDFDLV